MSTPTRSKLALKGSSKIISDFFEFCVHTILYQRGIYPSDEFKHVRKYNLPMIVSLDPEVTDYLNQLIKPIHKWIYQDKITRLVMVIVNRKTKEIVEKWEFQIELEKTNNISDDETQQSPEQLKIIQKTIQMVIKQITASITFLPILEGDFTFNVLVYANPNCKINEDWSHFDQLDNLVMDKEGVEQVTFKTIETSNHILGTSVTYKVNDYDV